MKYALMPENLPVVLKNIAPVILFFLYCSTASAQDKPDSSVGVGQIINLITASTDSFPPEKPYIQTDKPSYNTGDTLWFKSYLFNAAYLTASAKSRLLYIEIAREDNQVVKRIMVPLYDGLGRGDIALSEKEFPSGEYTLRAYTNWMRNFDESRVFQRQFFINDLSGQTWLINSRFSIPPEGSRQTAGVSLHFSQTDGQRVIARNLQLALTEGSRVWYKNKFQTDLEGALNFSFQIPEKADPRKLTITVKDLKEGSTGADLIVPVILNRKEHTDLQFMPEGGNLVAGIKNRIAFKAISEDGNGCDISGTIFNSSRQAVAAFKSTHLGMGSFYLLPLAGETYTAVIRLNGDQTKSYPLPGVKSSGIVLQVINPLSDDSVEVNIISTPDLQNKRNYYLVGQARGIGCLASTVILDQKTETFRFSKNIFPTGIARFTLLNAFMQPLSERVIFIDHHDQLHADIAYNKQYGTRDSVTMDISVSDRTGAPVQGSFSLAVTDDAQVNIDTVRSSSLLSTLLLTTDLKGWVEDPGYYFQPVMTGEIWENLDNLLLTQGWISYSRDSYFKPGPIQYNGEQSFSVSGKVTNIFNKPVAKSSVVLYAQKPVSLMVATTGKSGEFRFDNLYPIDKADYLIQARNKNGKSFNIGVEVNEFKPPVFKPLNRRIIPWYVNIDTGSLDAIHEQVAINNEIDKLLGKHVLKEVVIAGKKAVQQSKNLNGAGGSDFTLNQADLEKEGKNTLGQILAEKVKGFRLGGKLLNVYVINTALVHLIIDGVNVDFFRPPGLSDKDYYNEYLNYLTAEDIKGIEVMVSSRYAMTYFQKFVDPLKNPFDHVFIEITTYSGNGAFLKKTPGVYLYKPPVAYSIPAQFYSPKYPVKARDKFIDARSTIYWQPDIITGKDGKARVSFYTADKPGTYTLIMEGTDMNGNIESTRRKIIVK